MAVLDTYTNDEGETLKKIEVGDEIFLLESLLNSDENLEYSTYSPHDGGVVTLNTENLTGERVLEAFKTAEAELIASIGDCDEEETECTE